MSRRPLALSLLFLALWGFYLYSAGGTVVPYRDTGEMVINVQTLGLAHPPGYPLYVLCGKALAALPLGNAAYRANILSALAGALTGLLLLLALVRGGAGFMPALGSVLLWAGAGVFWELSSVSEMYALFLLALAAVMVLSDSALGGGSPKAILLLSLCLGMGLGARTDMALVFPALLLVVIRRRKDFPWALGAAFFAAGCLVFAFLPLRSLQQPWMDWNNPENLARLAASLLRKSHGGTLDLLSKNYAAGENFFSELWLYAKNTAGALGVLGLPLAALGLNCLWKTRRDFLGFSVLSFVALGPLFIYLANMPVNPHAVAIVEAHYAASQLVVALWAGAGMAFVWEKMRGPRGRAALLTAVLLSAAGNIAAHAPRGVKRWNFAARDWSTGVLRSAAPGSVGVAKKDVQLFALWERLWVEKARPDVDVLAQGLAASPWYWEMLSHQNRAVMASPLDTLEGWRRWLTFNEGRFLWVTGDVDLPGEAARLVPAGQVVYARGTPSSALAMSAPWDFALYRGAPGQDAAPDFFTADLSAELGRAALRASTEREKKGDLDGAAAGLLRALARERESPTALFHLGYVRFRQNRLEEADALYALALLGSGRLFEKARQYKSLPDVVAGLRSEAAQTWVHRGVVAEKRRNIPLARSFYEKALELQPRSADAHYNLAVTWWNTDWARAAEHMEAAAALKPENESYRSFAKRARQNESTP